MQIIIAVVLVKIDTKHYTQLYNFNHDVFSPFCATVLLITKGGTADINIALIFHYQTFLT